VTVRVPLRIVVFLAVGVTAASQSGNLIRIGDAPAVSIAAWRLILASLVLLPIAGRGLAQVRRLTAGEWGLLALAGAVLAGHLSSWIAAVQLTTVANAAVFFSINPVFTALAGHLLFGERMGPRFLGSLGLGLAGVVVMGAGDLSLAAGDLAGDGMAVLCSILFTAYFLLGKRLRQTLDSAVYVAMLYGIAGLCSLVAVAAMGLPAFDYSGTNWLCFALLAIVPTLIGHTSFNHSLRYVDAGRLSVVTLVEPLLAGTVAFLAWDEPVTVQAAAGYALIAGSVLLLGWDQRIGR
jgi:drug/metabolite transporter (DMT)-like permease